jgi:NAD(P)-dependent dehydrogenase (short-subunit alcohol dehydrogenase family)
MSTIQSLRTYGGAVAVVTGGGSGIGAALGRGLSARGAHVILTDRDEESARAEAEALVEGGGQAEAGALDVREGEAVEELVGRTFETHGRLDYLFNNAGIGIGGPVEDLDLGHWTDSIDVNLMGPIHGVRAAYPRMLDQGFGHIVNTASMAAFMVTAVGSPYGVAKSGVYALSRALRAEGADRGVRVSVLCPGVIRTPILRDGGRYGRTTFPMDPATQDALWERLRPMNVDDFAARSLNAVARNRGVIVIPAWWHLVRVLSGLFPALGVALARRELRRLGPLLKRTSSPPAPRGRTGDVPH